MKSVRWPIVLAAVGLLLLGLSFVGGPKLSVAAPLPAVVATPTIDLIEQGEALFRAKGCATCHESGLAGAPNLAVYDPDPAFVRVWLKDPAAVRPDTAMPNLHLSDAEIEALIAFLEDYSQR